MRLVYRNRRSGRSRNVRKRAGAGRARHARKPTTTPSATILAVSLGFVAWILGLKLRSTCPPVTTAFRSMLGLSCSRFVVCRPE